VSLILWLSEGDANTELFHLHVKHRRRKNLITKLITEGEVFTSHEDKKKIVLDFYSQLLGESVD